MKIRHLVLLAGALSLQASVASAEGVFKAAVYDEGTRTVLARAGGSVADPGASGARLVVKAGAEEAIVVKSVASNGEVLAERTLRTDALGIASAPMAQVAQAGPGTVLRVEQGSSGRVLVIGLGAGQLAAR
ncbi:MAG TPA: hypothetical protein VN324_04420 [Quisquiliibacterium sp.]|nr:hypothetical protein [Quisquiliibacterium sp.]